MSDAPMFESALPEWQPSHEPPAPAPWYRRRATKVTAAGVAAAGLVVGGFGVYTAASATLEPAQAIEEAFHNLAEEPVEVTLTSASQNDSTVTLTHTDAGTQVTMATPEGTFEAVLKEGEQRLYLRVDAQVPEVTDDPMLTGMLSGFSSVDSLLKGEWVSVDVSDDSKVVTALTGTSSATDDSGSDALSKAGEELSAKMASILGDLKEPAISAVTDHASVTTVGTDPASDGSEHYRVAVDVAAARADLQDDLRDALDDVLAAVDTFAGAAGEDVPGLAASLPELRAQLTAGLDADIPEDARTETADLYIADGQFTRIVADDLTLSFAADPALDDVSGAVSMDDDLVRLLPMLSGLMAMDDLSS